MAVLGNSSSLWLWNRRAGKLFVTTTSSIRGDQTFYTWPWKKHTASPSARSTCTSKFFLNIQTSTVLCSRTQICFTTNTFTAPFWGLESNRWTDWMRNQSNKLASKTKDSSQISIRTYRISKIESSTLKSGGQSGKRSRNKKNNPLKKMKSTLI